MPCLCICQIFREINDFFSLYEKFVVIQGSKPLLLLNVLKKAPFPCGFCCQFMTFTVIDIFANWITFKMRFF